MFDPKTAIADRLFDEFWDFAEALPRAGAQPASSSAQDVLNARMRSQPIYPHPTEPDGLPDGWETVWSMDDPDTAVYDEAPGIEWFLAQRPIEDIYCGWVLVSHYVAVARSEDGEVMMIPSTMVWETPAGSVQALYEMAVAAREANMGVESPDRMLREYVLSCYDSTDPTEAAEATLIGLGAPVTMFPRSLVPASVGRGDMTTAPA